MISLRQELGDLLGCPVDPAEAETGDPSPADPHSDPGASSGSVNKRIADYTTGGEQEFLASRLIQDGVVRNLEVIGEATNSQ